eukprot:403361362
MPPQSDFSLRKRSVPVHPKGFKNEWGALLQHQAEVQSLLEVEQHQKEMQKKQKFREELDKQLNGFREKALELDKEKHSFEQRQILEQNSHVFKQREQLQVMQERESTKRLMSDNLEQLKHRREQEKRQEEEEKQKFNQKIHHDKMYESMAKNYEEQQKQRQKQDLQDWYKDETYRKHQVAQMNREKERYDHHAFINHVDQNHQKAIKEHHDTINKHTQLREYKNAIGYVPVDQRQVQKEHAVESMKRQYEERLTEEQRKKQIEDQVKNQQKESIINTYKYQMEKRKQDQNVNKIEDRVYGNVLQQSIQTLNQLDQDKKVSQRYQAREYADTLQRQIYDHKDRELKKYNEMSDREKQLNIRPLAAYETMTGDINTKNIPGFERNQDKDNYRRFNRKGIPQALLNGQNIDVTDSISLIGGNDRRESPYQNGGSYTARDNHQRMSLPLTSSRQGLNDNMFQTLQGQGYKMNQDSKPQSKLLESYNTITQSNLNQLSQLNQYQNQPSSLLQKNLEINSYVPTAIEKAKQQSQGLEPRLRGNSSGGMSGVFSYNEEETKKQEQDRLKQIEERRRKELDRKSIEGVAGISSLLKNVELARYHQDAVETKQTYKGVQNNDFLTHRDNQRSSTLLSDIKKPDQQRSSLLNDYQSQDQNGSKTERYGKPDSTYQNNIKPLQQTTKVNKPSALDEMMDLLKNNRELDKRVIGSMRADHVQEGTKNVFYGQNERVTPLQMSARQGLLH